MTSSILKAGLFLAALVTVARADQVDNYIQAQMHPHHIPGLALAVVRDGKLIKSQGYGFSNVELKTPVTEQTVFEIGSLTKQFTAMLVLMLVEEGRIDLDAPPARYLDGLPASWNGIAIRRLLNHTSGLKNYTDLPGFEVRRKLTAAKFVNTLSTYPLDFQPGDSWSYCNSGYNLLGYILEKQSGKTYWELLQARILGPLQMSATCSRDLNAIIPHRAAGYEWEKNKLVNRDTDLTDVFAAGAIASTVLDLVQWCEVLESGKFLKTSNRELLWTPASLNKGRTYPYGFGWSLGTFKGRKYIGHGGSTAGFSSSLQRFTEEKLAVIVLCNLGEEGVASKIARGVAESYFVPGRP